jgi:beta-aspartyl-peptidase (threonine type)
MSNTIFDKIARKELAAYIVWEDKDYMAFLTPFPNTPGYTIVMPKTNQGDDIFLIDEKQYYGLLGATRKVALLLEKALGVKRVALAIEGTGVAYVHTKLIPLHGKLASQTDVWSEHVEFSEEYKGFITTAEGPKMDDNQLRAIQAKIVSAQKS